MSMKSEEICRLIAVIKMLPPHQQDAATIAAAKAMIGEILASVGVEASVFKNQAPAAYSVFVK